MIKYSICILTYKRPKLLEKLLDSLYLQEKINKSEFEIIVIDNDESQSAKIVVSSHKINNSYFSVRYYIQKKRNLSISRNLAINESKGYYILFIDDDEHADKFWAYELINSIYKYEADVVFGRLELSFDSVIPNYLKNRDFYFPKSLPSGSEAKVFYSGNVIIKKSILKELNLSFDEKYGLTGGEDSHLFQRIKEAGKKLIFTNEAVIYEFVPMNRGKLYYLLKRNFRSGNGYILRTIDLNSSNFILKIKLFTKTIVKLILYSFLILINLFIIKNLVRYILKFSSVLGELFAFFRFRLKMYN